MRWRHEEETYRWGPRFRCGCSHHVSPEEAQSKESCETSGD